MKAQLQRIGDSDQVSVHFNASSIAVLQSRKFNIEETTEGLLITFPKIDDSGARKVSSHSRDIEMIVMEDFENGWYEVEKLQNDDFLIAVDFE